MTRMKDITNSHKNFPKDNEIINVASFSNLNVIRNSLDTYFEHNDSSDQITEKSRNTDEANIQKKSDSTKKIIEIIEHKKELEEQKKIIKKEEVKHSFRLDSDINSKDLYNLLTNSIHNIETKILENKTFSVDEILPQIPILVKLNEESNTLLTKALNPGRATEWFASHSVNVAIISLKISTGLNYNTKQMYALALSALLHDIGMLKIHPDILNNHGQLSAMQKSKVRNHPSYGASLIAHLKAKYPFIEKTILQEHERWDGSGYPNHLKEEQINPFARIISLADKFESLIHERSYRPAYNPPLAIQKLINENHEAFDPKVLKAFINEISMYPVGSYVLLNNGQVAQVMSINKNRPVRPFVNLLTSNDGKKLDNPVELNLEKEPLTYITKTVSYLD